ncbi:MAG: Fic family protein [Candidatus Berkelbacteria bacterium]|nr:Fic family protein [Candidatus Berkelbacteria bacterium]
MTKISPKQQNILEIILGKGSMQSSAIHEEILIKGDDLSLVSVKRILSEMVSLGLLIVAGVGRSTSYSVSNLARVFLDIDAKEYIEIEPDKRFGLSKYNFDYFSQFPTDIFSEKELEELDQATKNYKQKTRDLSKVIEEKELQRLIIELSWKSSKIEGNTYTLLDTEKLIVEKEEAKGHDKKEAIMILNHKDVFNFIRENSKEFKTLTRANLEKLHSILVKDMGVSLGIRNRLVGVVGSKYQPLDNKYQINEAINALADAISKAKTPYAKALLALTGIGYIQPFEDGNKRTGRLMTNALLLSWGFAPLSYRSVEESDYRNAMLVFYEINSIVPFKKIFLSQYEFAANNYAVKQAT